MASVNKVFLLGNLTRDPELKYTQTGLAVCTFGIAVNNIYTAQNGEVKKEVDFIRISVFGKQAENCAKYLNKGRPVFVEGRLKFHSWETPDGQKKSNLDVVANNIQFLGGKPGSGDDSDAAHESAGSESSPTQAPPMDDVPF
ncbi:single-stranded DNA-binding protein [Candidatus Poribacteria bacterium]|nr:single-stranded DNA-binding protein [Candidatus Poribacteria bacterium]